jgi:hypothetical protein
VFFASSAADASAVEYFPMLKRVAAEWRAATLPADRARLFSAAFSPLTSNCSLASKPGDIINIDCYAFENTIPESTFV